MRRHIRRRRPIVVVIEHPEEGPDVFVLGEVELITATSYPATAWGDAERAEWTNYPAHLRALAARVRTAPGAAVSTSLSSMMLELIADETDRRNQEAGL